MDIEAVVFDLGGVLIEWDPRQLYRRLLPEDDVDPFLEEIGFLAWNHACDAGMPWDEAVAELSGRHPGRSELIAAYPARFAESLVGPIEGSVEILGTLRARGVALLALTNWSAESFQHARDRFEFLTWFSGIVVSGEERVAKPDPRIFQVLIERYRLDPARTLFIDDAAQNVAAAQRAGLRALRFIDPGQLRKELASIGLLAST